MCWTFPFLWLINLSWPVFPIYFPNAKYTFFPSMLLSHYFIVSSNVVQCSGSKASRQMIQHKSLRDHSGRIPLCVEGSHRKQKTHTSARTHTVSLCRLCRCTCDTWGMFWTHVSGFISVALERSVCLLSSSVALCMFPVVSGSAPSPV